MKPVLGLITALGAVVACTQPPPSNRASTESAATAPEPARPSDLPVLDRGATKLMPVDQADSTFRAFREELLAALARRDTSFLFGIVVPEIQNSFGPDDGIDRFRDKWRPADADSPVWDALARVLTLGGKLQVQGMSAGRMDSTFWAPYVAAFWPDAFSAFDYISVVRENALLHASPAGNGRAIGKMSYAILRVEEWPAGDETPGVMDTGWIRVRVPNGRQAWLRAGDAHSPTGLRALFERREGRWLLTKFLAGD